MKFIIWRLSLTHLSFSIPEYTAQVNAIGCLRLLEAIQSKCPNAKFYQASTSELYGDVNSNSQNENTPFNPCSHIPSRSIMRTI